MEYMCNTIYNERLPRYLPKNITIAHKIGNWVGEYHDVGIVFSETPYIIAVMSSGTKRDDAFEAISHISRMVYDYSINGDI